MRAYAGHIDPRTAILATYALCGFSNLGSVGIQIGGISALAPDRRGDLAKSGAKGDALRRVCQLVHLLRGGDTAVDKANSPMYFWYKILDRINLLPILTG